jgi:isoleucyl-tRNA synthetase
MAWTTTPWTLPSNLGLTVGPNIDYVLVKTFNPYTFLPVNVILAKALLGKYFKPEGENGSFEEFNEKTKLLPWTILANFKGADIEGMDYEQLLPYEANSLEAILTITPDAKPFKIVSGDFVTTEDGTGIVHTAPAFGADDYKVGKKFNIGILTMVDREGKFVDGLGPFSNRFVKNYKDDPAYVDVNVDICVHLKKENRAFKVEKYEHSYPHCWRTDKPILYYPLDAWFIKTTAVKDRMVELNKTINWKPKSTGEGRFGNWLENMVDWNLSRSRYWGTPLPVWRTEDGGEEICIGSIAELNEGIRKANEVLGGDINKNYLHGGILDLHKPFVDEIILVSPSGKPMNRVPDLIDVWFDSGAMPYAQWHYPFENKDLIDKGEAFPADFIAEGVDQTRGWFYTLHALGVMLFDSVAYKAVVSNGLVLDKNGNKMSKRLGNVVNPFETIEQYGADATRWYLITNASPWDNLKFDMAGIQEVQRKFFGTLYNTYQFFSLYANVDGFAYKEAPIPLEQRPEIDRWILSALNTLIKQVTDHMNDFEPTLAGRAVETFVDAQLSNWYVRLCRRRFWKGEYETDKISAYQTLYECLETVVRLIAPISPFFSDAVFANLNAVTNRFQVASVHHADYPVSNPNMVDPLLEERMQLAQETCSLVLSLRKKVNIKVRQPLQKVMIPVLNIQMKEQLEKMESLIMAEVNVKEIEYITATQGVISKKIKANFKTLGAKLGASMKEAAATIAGFTQEQIADFELAGTTSLSLTGGVFTIDLLDVEITAEDIPGWSVASKGKLTVALDITISDELKQEGEAREFVNRVQNIRKESGFELTDRIFVELPEGTPLKPSIIKFNDYICREILADAIEWTTDLTTGIPIEVNDIALTVVVNKKG